MTAMHELAARGDYTPKHGLEARSSHPGIPLTVKSLSLYNYMHTSLGEVPILIQLYPYLSL